MGNIRVIQAVIVSLLFTIEITKYRPNLNVTELIVV